MVRRLFPPLLLAAALALPCVATASPPVIDWAVISQGGGRMSNGTLVMDLTIGEPIVGATANGSLQADFGYWWIIRTVNVAVEGAQLPVAYAMRQNAPNPFMTRTTIAYAIPQGQQVPVFIGIYDLNGRLVKTLVHETKPAGQYSIVWDGTTDSGSPSLAGVYFAQLHAGSFQRTSKLVMLK
jgi:hypothetical protein